MSIAAFYRHTLTRVRTTEVTTSLDPEGADLGHGSASVGTGTPFQGLIQPRRASELASILGTAPSVNLFRIYLPVMDVTPDDVIRKTGSPDTNLNGDYRVSYVGNAAGQGHHLELDAERIT